MSAQSIAFRIPLRVANAHDLSLSPSEPSTPGLLAFVEANGGSYWSWAPGSALAAGDAVIAGVGGNWLLASRLTIVEANASFTCSGSPLGETIYHATGLTAARAATIPAGLAVGSRITIGGDGSLGGGAGANVLTVTATGATIIGQPSYTLTNPWQRATFEQVASNVWVIG